MDLGGSLLALAVKDLRLLLRDRSGAFVTFVFPFAYSIFFGLVLGARYETPPILRVAVVDEDRTPCSRAFVRHVDDSDMLSVSEVSIGAAADLVRRGKVVASISLPHGFEEAMKHPSGNHEPRIAVSADPARTAELTVIKSILAMSVLEIRAMASSSISIEPDDPKRPDDRARSDIPTLVDDDKWGRVPPADFVVSDASPRGTRPRNSYAISFPQGVIWGVLGCCASFSISIATERTRGTLARLRIAPISRATILAGKALACLGAIGSLGVCVFAVGWIAFDVVPESVVNLLISLMLVSLAFVGLMMLLATLGRTERSASGFSWAVLLAMAMLGGGMVPVMFMPRWMQTLGHISPITWAILAMEGAVWRDFTIDEMLRPWLLLASVGATCFVIGAKMLAGRDGG